MRQQTLQHGFTTGRELWLCLAVALGLVLGAETATAKECHQETPLAADMQLVAPSQEVPEAVARFAGAWIGAWPDQGREALCHTLVVERVFANGAAGVIYSIGTYEGWNIRQPHFWRATGWIVNGVLHFSLPLPGSPDLAYRFTGEALQGTFKGEGRVRLNRVADVSQVGCASQPEGFATPPPVTGPRDRLTAAKLSVPAEAGTGLGHNAYFMPVGQAAPAVHALKGTLRIGPTTLVRARQGCAGLSETLPSFSVAFFTHGEYLVPVARDIVNPPGMILAPGRVWSEPGDGRLPTTAGSG